MDLDQSDDIIILILSFPSEKIIIVISISHFGKSVVMANASTIHIELLRIGFEAAKIFNDSVSNALMITFLKSTNGQFETLNQCSQ